LELKKVYISGKNMFSYLKKAIWGESESSTPAQQDSAEATLRSLGLDPTGLFSDPVDEVDGSNQTQEVSDTAVTRNESVVKAGPTTMAQEDLTAVHAHLDLIHSDILENEEEEIEVTLEESDILELEVRKNHVIYSRAGIV
jgi:hypothetical protein